MNFLLRHPLYAASNPKRSWLINKAQREYVKAHPACAWTGKTKGVEAHHKKSFHTHPELAADPGNFIGLVREAHWMVGHGGISWSASVENVQELCEAKRMTREKESVLLSPC